MSIHKDLIEGYAKLKTIYLIDLSLLLRAADEIEKLENLRFNNTKEIKNLKRELAAEQELH